MVEKNMKRVSGQVAFSGQLIHIIRQKIESQQGLFLFFYFQYAGDDKMCYIYMRINTLEGGWKGCCAYLYLLLVLFAGVLSVV